MNDNRVINSYTGLSYSILGILFIILSHNNNIEYTQKVLFPQIMYTILGVIYYSFFVYDEFTI